MKILGLDTSSNILSIAISNDKNIIVEDDILAKEVLSGIITPSINKILKKAKVSLSSLDGFAVGIGPGSFTGLRIGLATIKGFAFAFKKPCVGISSLDIIAMNASLSDLFQICPILDAKRDLVYSALYTKTTKGIKRLTKLMLIGIDKLLNLVSNRVIFLGDGLLIYRKIIERKRLKDVVFEPKNLWYPEAKNLIMLAKERFQKGLVIESAKLLPIYLYPKECQIRIPLSESK